MNRPGLTCLVVAWASTIPCFGDWKQDVGYTSLKLRLGAGLPTGAGLYVTHVEAPSGGNYLPDTTNAQFAGKTITALSGSSGASSHATAVGQNYYGISSSLAPGVTSILAYNANGWIASDFLYAWSSLAPFTEYSRVQNHSWIGTTNDVNIDTDILRRVDLAIERDGIVVAVGVNNGTGSAIPRLLGSAYNVIAVGLTNGNSSYGPTTLDVAGRVKPDIVAPASATSWATPMVASAATILLQAEDDDGVLSYLPTDQQRPARALLAKTLLMAGATKDEFSNWRRGMATPSTDGSVPLDYRYGAGELNIDNSFRILAAGEQNSGTVDVGLSGWDFDVAVPTTPRRYFFQIPAYSYATKVSALVAWHRHIATSTGSPLLLTPSLANIDLRLRQVDGATVGAERDLSISTVNNIEHIFMRSLGSGRYCLEISTNLSWNYALAWDLQLAPTAPVDFDGDGDVDRTDFLAFRTCQNDLGPANPYTLTALPQGCQPLLTNGVLTADLDHDGDVDQADFGRFQVCLGAEYTPPPAQCFSY